MKRFVPERLVALAVLQLTLAAMAQTPEAHWPFDTDGGDLSGNARHCALLNGAAVNNSNSIIGFGSLGGQGAGGALDGIAPPGNDYAQANGGTGGVAWNGVTGSAARSISVWFKGP